MGRAVGLTGEEREDLKNAAFLHDIGHLTMGIAAADLEVPGHAEAGETIVAGAKFPEEVAAAVRHHHERWDGQGKPDGMAGEAIPRAARILAVAEAFEAMTAGRGCERLAPAAAVDKLKAGAGSEFDPAIVDALSRSLGDGGLEPTLPAVALPAVAEPAIVAPAPA